MAVTIPNPYGKADWTDYKDYWRDEDATYLQDRSILRYALAADRNTSLSAATAGQTTYLANPDRIEFKSAAGNWVGVIGAQNLKASPVNAANADEAVTLSQTASTGGAGLTIGKNLTSIGTNSDFNGVLKVTGVGAAGHIDIKTGAKTVVLTTNGTHLMIDSPVHATALGADSINTTGAITTASVTATGEVKGATVTSTGSISAITSVAAATAAIGGVSIGTNRVTASQGFVSQQGRFYGTANSATMGQWNGTTDGASFVEVTNTNVHLVGSANVTIEGQTYIYQSKGVQYYTGATHSVPGTRLGYGGPVVYSTTALNAANYPPGTIWVS